MSEPIIKLTPADLSALMCGRICHDLISPVSALSTAIEVLDDPDNVDMREDALDLVRTSSKQASGKLQFLRLAFGAGSSAPGVVSMDMLKTITAGKYEGGKVNLHWDTGSIDGVEKTSARLLLNLIMLGMSSIPRGGDLTIKVTETGEAVLIDVEAKGLKARIDEMVTRTLSGKAPEDGFDGRSIQPFYTGMIVRQLKGRVDTSLADETARLTAFVPKNEALKAA